MVLPNFLRSSLAPTSASRGRRRNASASPEQVADRGPQRGAYFHTGPETLFEDFGFTRQRQIAKWRWVMRLRLDV